MRDVAAAHTSTLLAVMRAEALSVPVRLQAELILAGWGLGLARLAALEAECGACLVCTALTTDAPPSDGTRRYCYDHGGRRDRLLADLEPL